MKTYIGTKIIQARPMDEVTFLVKMGRDTPNRESRSGYLVVYPDGYESWSPREAFENAYRELSREEFNIIK